jgi:hypothetical protein
MVLTICMRIWRCDLLLCVVRYIAYDFLETPGYIRKERELTSNDACQTGLSHLNTPVQSLVYSKTHARELQKHGATSFQWLEPSREKVWLQR